MHGGDGGEALTERWHRRCTTVRPRRRTGLFGGGGTDEGVPAAQCLGGASASTWRVWAAAVRRFFRRRVGAGRWRREGGVLGRAGKRDAGDQNRAAPLRPCPCRSWHGPVHANVGIDIVLSRQGSKWSVVCVTLRQNSRPTSLLNKLFADLKVGPIKSFEKQCWPKMEYAF